MLYTDIIDSICSCISAAGANCINEFDSTSADSRNNIFCTAGIKNVRLSDKSFCCGNGSACECYSCECTVRIAVNMKADCENDGRTLVNLIDTAIVPALLNSMRPVSIEVSECAFDGKLRKIQCVVLATVIGTVPCGTEAS